ncbi:MAG: hypothetical protein P9L97_09315 [Candidatus Tenebribacter davisii]|nr:hypothetical protein [Candidatus Tenebribacter davisii]
MNDNEKFNIDLAVITSIPIEVVTGLTIFDGNYEKILIDPCDEDINFGFKSYVERSYYENDLEAGNEPTLFHCGYIETNGNKKLSLVIAKLTSYGGLAISSFITWINSIWKPKNFLLLGIAMAFNDEYKLGEVVFPTYVLSPIISKFRGPDKNSLKYDYTFNSDFHKTFLNNREDEIIFDGKKIITHQGHYYSSNELIASTSYRYLIKSQYPSMDAGEMEINGVLFGAGKINTHFASNFYVIKGISDYGIDEKQDTKYRFEAAINSAKLVRYFIKEDVIQGQNKEFLIDESLSEITEAERFNWIGEMQFSQGLFNHAEYCFLKAWDLVNFNDKEILSKSLAQKISKNMANVNVFTGKQNIALKFALISLMHSKFLKKSSQADSHYITGRVLRECELMKACLDFLTLAKEEYDNDNDFIGLANSLRWIGYTKYKQGDYIEVYCGCFFGHENQ